MASQSYIYGIHPVEEALLGAPHVVRQIFFIDSDLPSIKARAKELRIPAGSLSARDLPREVEKDAVHQGVIAQIEPTKLLVPYKQFAQDLTVTPATGIVVLGELQDPHNVGAVIRSAAAFGAAAVLIPEHRQTQITGTVVKVSAGMAFRIPLVSIANVNNTLRDLKERGFWIYGLDAEGDRPLEKEQFDTPSAFVLGNEGRGIREKSAELCDLMLKIPINPRCESLNASASAAVTLYAWSTSQRQ